METNQEECLHETKTTTSEYCCKCNKNLYEQEDVVVTCLCGKCGKDTQGWETIFDRICAEHVDLDGTGMNKPPVDKETREALREHFHRTLQAERERLIKEIEQWIEKYEMHYEARAEIERLKQFLTKIRNN